ncbi:MAG TPA: hypothetical protein ENG48_12465 [Candidatus Atribacteria bacterium]|nr:hypothetical protein [Candidatus Atribacteria bacterium]
MSKKDVLIVWLSRHPMDRDALEALKVDIAAGVKESGDKFGELLLEHKNITWATDLKEISKQFKELDDELVKKYTDKLSYSLITGVFPAQVMYYLVKNRMQFATAVSIPAPAKEGETRKFKFKEWLYW